MHADLLLPCGFGPGTYGEGGWKRKGMLKEEKDECGLSNGTAPYRVDVFVF